MLELLCNIGWILVGILGALHAVMLFELRKVFVQAWKEWHEEDNEEE